MLLFQSVRELLMNIVKHAGTNETMIKVVQSVEALAITVSDRVPVAILAAETGFETGSGCSAFASG